MQAKLRHDEQQREAFQREMDAKVHAVEQRAAKATGEARTALEARVAALRAEFKLGKAKRAATSAAGGHH